MPSRNYSDLQFDAIIAYVDANFTDPALSVDQLCTAFDTSPYSLGCCFKDLTGKTFLEYVIDLRMARAKELLLSDAYDIKAVAAQVGYPYPSYFARTFKKRFGVTPSAFREQNR